MNIPECFYRVSAKALILDDKRRFLLVQEDNGMGELPGGGLDFGEDPSACIRREIKEEMGLEVTYIKNRPSYFTTSIHTSKEWYAANIIYEVNVENLNFTSSEECRAIRFFTLEEASRENVFANVREFLKHYKASDHQ